MHPTLHAGDHVIVIRRRVRTGDIVAIRDPRRPARILVKRVERVDANGAVTVAGDNPEASTDSRHFGLIAPSLVVGRVVYRYAPSERAGRVG